MARVIGNGKLSTLATALGSTTMTTAIGNHYPNLSLPVNLLSKVNDTYINIEGRRSLGSGASGTIGVTSGFTASSGMGTVTCNYVNLSENGGNVTIRATATYPNYVAGWYTAANGGGDQLVAGGNGTTTLDIVIDSTTAAIHDVVYAYFGYTAPTNNQISLNNGSTAAQACNANSSLYYSGETSNDFHDGPLYTNSAGTSHAAAGWYSNDLEVYYYNGSGGWSSGQLCTF